MKTYGGVDVWIHVFLTSALDGGERSSSHPGHITPGERATGTHWIEGWVGPRAGLNDVERRKILPLPGLELRPAAVQPVASRYTDCANPTLCTYVCVFSTEIKTVYFIL
jgi:hypothetical protein